MRSRLRSIWPLAVLLAVVVALAALMAGPLSAAVTTYYVDDDTCPSVGSGTLLAPYCAIQSAIEVASTDDIISVAAGMYEENLVIDEQVTLLGANAGNPGTGTRGDESIIAELIPGGGLVHITASNVTLDGFTIRGTGVVEGWIPGCVYITSGTGMTVENNIIQFTGAEPAESWGGIINSGSIEATIKNNLVENFRLGVYLNPGAAMTISNNTIVGSWHCGIGVDSDAGVTITSNSVDNNAVGIEVFKPGVTAHYNNIEGNSAYGVWAATSVDASLNWWGSANGPGQDEANDVEGDVDASPWLPGEWETYYDLEAEEEIDTDEDDFSDLEEYWLGTDPDDDADYPGAAVEEAATTYAAEGGTGGTETTNASVTADAAEGESASVSLAEYADNPVPEESVFGAVGSYIDVHTETPENLDEVIIRVNYDQGALTVPESTLRMYYWNSEVSDWRQCSDQGVNAANDFIWAAIRSDTTPDLSYLAGGPFGGGALEVTLDEAWYKTDDPVTVTVEDQNKAGWGAVGVYASSEAHDTMGPVALTETDPGVFVGTFVLVDTTPGPGELLVGHGNTVTVGYPDLTGVTATATVDNVAATITGLTPGDDSVVSDDPLVISAALDDGDGCGVDSESVVITVNGVDVTEDEEVTVTESSVTYTYGEGEAAEGLYEVTVDASDNVGNAPDAESWSFTYDVTGPAVENQTPAPDIYIATRTPTVSFDVSDPNGITRATISLGIGCIGTVEPAITPTLAEATAYHVEYQVSTLEGACFVDGEAITVTVNATDLALNDIAVEDQTWEFTYDATAPELEAAVTGWTWDAVGEASEDTNSRTSILATFSEELDEATVAVSDFLVAGLVTPSAIEVQDNLVFLILPEEMATDATPSVELVAEVRDIAGNAQTEREVEEAEDDIDPILTVAVDPELGMDETEVTITVTSSEALDGLPIVEVTDPEAGSVDLDAPGMVVTDTTTWEGTYTLDDTEAEGTYAVAVNGTDLNENIAAEVTAELEGDFTPPSVSAFTPADGIEVASTHPWITIEFTEDVQVLEATFDEADVLAQLYVVGDALDQYTLATADLAMGDHTISVLAVDAAGNEMPAADSATFTVVVATADIQLYPGWNLLSLPLIPDDSSIETVLGDVIVDSVWAYDTVQGWLVYSPPPAPSFLDEITDGVGYWIEMTAPDIVSVTGVTMPEPPSVPPSYSVDDGWNLIGFKSMVEMACQDYLTSIDGQYAIVWAYRQGVYVPIGGADNLIPGEGLWIWMLQASIIVPPA